MVRGVQCEEGRERTVPSCACDAEADVESHSGEGKDIRAGLFEEGARVELGPRAGEEDVARKEGREQDGRVRRHRREVRHRARRGRAVLERLGVFSLWLFDWSELRV